MFDPGASKASVVFDRQLAHEYINDASVVDKTKMLLKKAPVIEFLLDETARQSYHHHTEEQI